MIFTGDNDNLSVLDFVNQTMFIGDAAAPMAGQIMLERFGLADPVERVSDYIFDKGVNLFKDFPVFFSPLHILKKGIVLKNNHLFLLCSFSALIRSSSVSKEMRFFPSSTFFIASIKRLRLAGELSRYSVVSGSRISISTTWLGYVVLIVSINVLSSSLVFSLYVVVILLNIHAARAKSKGWQ